MADSTATNQQDLVIERVFDAPVERVWAAWSQSELMKRWWGPKDFTAPNVRMDFRVGGKYLYCMHGAPAPGAEARDFWSTGEYKEIVPMQKIVCTDSFADPEGNIVPASYYGMQAKYPLELLVTVTFEALSDGKTKMTLRHAGMPMGEPEADGARIGWNQSFDKLAASLSA